MLISNFNFTISPNANAVAQRTTVPSCSEFTNKLLIAVSNFLGNNDAILPITLALSHLILGAFSVKVWVTNSNQNNSAISGFSFVAYSNDSIQVAFIGCFYALAKVINSFTLFSLLVTQTAKSSVFSFDFFDLSFINAPKSISFFCQIHY